MGSVFLRSNYFSKESGIRHFPSIGATIPTARVATAATASRNKKTTSTTTTTSATKMGSSSGERN